MTKEEKALEAKKMALKLTEIYYNSSDDKAKGKKEVYETYSYMYRKLLEYLKGVD